MNKTYREINLQYAVHPSLPTWGDLEGLYAFDCMKAYSYNGERFGYYGYDASGERTYKMDINYIGIFTNEYEQILDNWELGKMMLYPNGYMNMNQNGEYTKHYYADALRIASKIGSGFDENLCDNANDMENNYPNYLSDRMTEQYTAMIDELYETAMFSAPSGTLSFVNPYSDFCNLGSGGHEPDLFFYHPDHLGSTGMVTDINATITQGFLYAPFGEIMTEYNPGWQADRIPKYAFNAKELDEENGMYYYSARYLKPPTFISRDMLFERKHWLNPYHYCSNSPINKVDPSGMSDEPVFDSKGNFRGTTKEGYTGQIIIYDGKKDFSQMTAGELLYDDDFDIATQRGDAASYDRVRGELSNEAKSKIWTHVADQLNGKQIFDETFSINSIINEKVSYGSVDGGNWATRIYSDGSFELMGTDRYSYETTVENVQASLIYHEWYGHGMKKYGDRTLDHTCCYEAVMESPIFQKTTTNYQNFVKKLRDWYGFLEGRK